MGLRAAINAKCKDCIYDACSPGTWREQVDACTSDDCALYPYRPRKTTPKRPKKAESTESQCDTNCPSGWSMGAHENRECQCFGGAW